MCLCCACEQGIGKTLNPSYNFSEVATPYAQELLQLQDGQQQGFIIEQLQQQATEVRPGSRPELLRWTCLNAWRLGPHLNA